MMIIIFIEIYRVVSAWCHFMSATAGRQGSHKMNEAAFDLIDGIPHYKLVIDGQWVRSSRNQLADDIHSAT